MLIVYSDLKYDKQIGQFDKKEVFWGYPYAIARTPIKTKYGHIYQCRRNDTDSCILVKYMVLHITKYISIYYLIPEII